MRFDFNLAGIMDEESSIKNMVIAVFEQNESEAFDNTSKQVSRWVDVGPGVTSSVFFESPLQTRRKYFIKAKARDAAGHSSTCESDGIDLYLHLQPHKNGPARRRERERARVNDRSERASHSEFECCSHICVKFRVRARAKKEG
jgi:hypothetical protein